MDRIAAVPDMRRAAERCRAGGRRIGFVPTMGALHEGHLSLVRAARRRSDTVVVSVFVNPTQFAPGEDLARYPRDLERDARLAAEAGADVLFAPPAEEMYPRGFRTAIDIEGWTSVLEGASRPGHFRGVLTVVAKLFAIVLPHIAVFGQKDAQQSVLVRRMARDLDFDVEIAVEPTVREPDGLAMSSRNVYLSAREREDALVLSRALAAAERLHASGERDAHHIQGAVEDTLRQVPAVRQDYTAVVDADTLEPLERLRDGTPALVAVAARVGGTRLIDNTILGSAIPAA
jgi:pantoate--beta-alanine ligase